jgi:hypothetical protein
MKDQNILQEKDFRYEVFKPSVGSDSGMLMLATKLTDERVQYVVKCQVEWNPVSEFIYHKVSAALELYTQEVKLFKSLFESKYACGIRYCSNARKTENHDIDDLNLRDFIRFCALYQILDEEDSEEYYTDEQNRLFKLDNAEAFLLSCACSLLIKKAKTKSQWIKMAIDEELEKYLKKQSDTPYGMMADKISEVFGKEAVKIYLDTFVDFAGLELTVLNEAFASLDKVYPKTFSEYLHHYLEARQPICRKFAVGYAL